MSTDATSSAPPAVDAGPLGFLPRLDSRHARLTARLDRGVLDPGLVAALGWLSGPLGEPVAVLGPPEVAWRASGLLRPSVVAQFSWPSRATRLGLGIETPPAHALIDRLLGYDRPPGDERRPMTPIEWGLMTFAVARGLSALVDRVSRSDLDDLAIDRVGPDPFVVDGLGPMVTLRWTVRVGSERGSARLWLPESLIAPWLAPLPPRSSNVDPASIPSRLGGLTGLWRAEAGTIAMPRGLGIVRVGGVLPIVGNPLRGTPSSPAGPVVLSLRDRDGRCLIPAEPASATGGGRLIVTAPWRREPETREALAVSVPSDPSPAPAPPSPGDVPVTLTVELGRISLSLLRVADLKPGDVLELGRHAREPVELTSSGRLVARGELVQIDTELGVRVTSVFL